MHAAQSGHLVDRAMSRIPDPRPDDQVKQTWSMHNISDPPRLSLFVSSISRRGAHPLAKPRNKMPCPHSSQICECSAKP
ncbi:hypothetical protein ASPCADRAFT_212448 [Aspergillus carbonarius ITEM 5010]|uniref:Uncharacterized protein n=1 Tax=Aspergillus carbonarius (strain ITEM 5010) TaxID=602072 RepID=A0A1R3R5S6_ASPC5|nr:hypothetical protein ASPCADRAFT_212448 [Aspergillus carbonarius ITEM 5010]